MGHDTNLATIKSLLTETYKRQKTNGVPKRPDLTFGNTLKEMPHAVVMYVDMRGSRKLLSQTTEFVSMKAHKAFLQAIVYCVENRDGHFRSFNGDGTLSFFVGENAASRAVRAALDLKAYVRQINKILEGEKKVGIDFGVGLGQGPVYVAKSGKRGDDETKQDLVWIGLPVYVAVELSDLAKGPNNLWISPAVRDTINKENQPGVVTSGNKNMWTVVTRKLKSIGECKPRYTGYYSTLF
jgi:adenylate cyclase